MVAGLTPVMPSGAVYMMVGVELDKFPHISTAVDFMEKLMLEESVYILPGEVSNITLLSAKGIIRIINGFASSICQSNWHKHWLAIYYHFHYMCYSL